MLVGPNEGIFEMGLNPGAIVLTIIDVHGVGDILLSESTHQSHVTFDGEIMVAHGHLPVDRLPGFYLIIRSVLNPANRIVLLDNPLAPVGRGVVLQEVEMLTAQVAADVVDHTKHLRMMYTKDRCASATHGETTDGATALIGTNTIGLFDIGDELLEEEVLVFPVGCAMIAFLCIKVHHILLIAFGRDDDDILNGATVDEAVGYQRDVMERLIVGMCATAAMQEIEHGVGLLNVFLIAARQIDGVVALGDTLQQFAGGLQRYKLSWALLEVLGLCAPTCVVLQVTIQEDAGIVFLALEMPVEPVDDYTAIISTTFLAIGAAMTGGRMIGPGYGDMVNAFIVFFGILISHVCRAAGDI